MPMTEKLETALNNPTTTGQQIAMLLKQDGINCREGNSFDTPLIIATRCNNFQLVHYLLSNVKSAAEKTQLLTSLNKDKNSALGVALKSNTDKKIALLLLKNGASLSVGVSQDLSAETKEWIQPFKDIQKNQEQAHLSANELVIRGNAEFEIGERFANLLGDETESHKWFELAAEDGNKHGMLKLGYIYHHHATDLEKALYWCKKSYPLWTDEINRNEVISLIKSIAQLSADNLEAALSANLFLGTLYSKENHLSLGLSFFAKAEEIYVSSALTQPDLDLFFKAFSFWNGSCYNKGITALDYLDVAKRFIWLAESDREESHALLTGVAATDSSPILQLIACQIGKLYSLLTDSESMPVTLKKNEALFSALAILYGWNGQPKNTLRAAGLLKKLIPTINNNETIYLIYTLIAFAYLQQEKERDLYIAEAFHSLDAAHASLQSLQTPLRKEIIKTIIDGVVYV